MNERRKIKGRNNWNRKRPVKKIDIPLADTKPFVIKTEVPNIVTLRYEERFYEYCGPIPIEYIEHCVARSLADEIVKYIDIRSTRDEIMDHLCVRGTVRIIDDRKE